MGIFSHQDLGPLLVSKRRHKVRKEQQQLYLKTHPTLKRRNYTAADSSSDSDNVVMSVKYPSLRIHSKDIPHTSTTDPSSDSSTDTTSSFDAPVDIGTTAAHEDGIFPEIDSVDHDPQEPDSQRESDIHTGHIP